MAEPSEARLVGRDVQLEALLAALALAAGGRPTAVVVAGELGVGRVVEVGPAAAAIVEGARETSEEEPVQVEDNAAAVTWLREHTGAGDVVLVKASRGARLDEVADALLEVDA